MAGGHAADRPAVTKAMRIVIDARWIFEEISGIGTYTQELIRHLVPLDRQNQFLLLFDNARLRERTFEAAGLGGAPNVSSRVLSFGPFAARSQWLLPAVLRQARADVFHSPNYMIPLLAFPRSRAGFPRCVVTIHDLIPLLFPEQTPKAKKVRLLPVFRWLMREIGARADTILTVSETSRKDVIEQLGIPEARQPHVLSIPNGVAPEYKPTAKQEAAWRTILYVGRFDPYKNVTGLLRAFARVREISKSDVRLRIVGPRDPRYPEAPRLAKELGLDPWIQWSGYAAPDELARAYQQADVFVLQSKYEGFGLTVLEAMACGTPVVCSDRSSLPDVAGDAAVLVDPDDIEQVAQAVVGVLDDSRRYGELREKGLRRAAKFTWQRTAEMTLGAYERAMR